LNRRRDGSEGSDGCPGAVFGESTGRRIAPDRGSSVSEGYGRGRKAVRGGERTVTKSDGPPVAFAVR